MWGTLKPNALQTNVWSAVVATPMSCFLLSSTSSFVVCLMFYVRPFLSCPARSSSRYDDHFTSVTSHLVSKALQEQYFSMTHHMSGFLTQRLTQCIRFETVIVSCVLECQRAHTPHDMSSNHGMSTMYESRLKQKDTETFERERTGLFWISSTNAHDTVHQVESFFGHAMGKHPRDMTSDQVLFPRGRTQENETFECDRVVLNLWVMLTSPSFLFKLHVALVAVTTLALLCSRLEPPDSDTCPPLHAPSALTDELHAQFFFAFP